MTLIEIDRSYRSTSIFATQVQTSREVVEAIVVRQEEQFASTTSAGLALVLQGLGTL